MFCYFSRGVDLPNTINKGVFEQLPTSCVDPATFILLGVSQELVEMRQNGEHVFFNNLLLELKFFSDQSEKYINKKIEI